MHVTDENLLYEGVSIFVNNTQIASMSFVIPYL